MEYHPDSFRYHTLIFDFDGTIADTLEASRKVYNELAVERGFRSVEAEEVAELRHHSVKELTAKLGVSKLKLPGLLAEGVKRMRSQVSGLAPIEGMDAVLRSLHGRSFRLGILTSNSTENVERFLETHGMRGIFDFISSTGKLSGKAKHIRSIRRTFSLEKEHVLYIGDEIRDVKASLKAGVDVAAVTWGFNSPEALEESKPTYQIDTPSQLLEIEL